MCSYAIKIPVADRNFFVQYSVWILGGVQHYHIATEPPEPQIIQNKATVIKKTLKLYGPFLWMGLNCLKARATSRRQFTFYY